MDDRIGELGQEELYPCAQIGTQVVCRWGKGRRPYMVEGGIVNECLAPPLFSGGR